MTANGGAEPDGSIADLLIYTLLAATFDAVSDTISDEVVGDEGNASPPRPARKTRSPIGSQSSCPSTQRYIHTSGGRRRGGWGTLGLASDMICVYMLQSCLSTIHAPTSCCSLGSTVFFGHGGSVYHILRCSHTSSVFTPLLPETRQLHSSLLHAAANPGAAAS